MAENKQPLTFDVQGETLTPYPPKIDLRDAAAIRRELCAVYREAKAGGIEIADATKLVYILDAIRKAHEAEVLEQRLERIELTLKPRGKK